MTRARDVANLIGSGNYSSTTFTATAGQTAFTISHTQGFVQVFMNGLLLDETVDYTSNGSAVTLTSGAAAGDEIEVVAYNTFSVGDALNQAAADTRYVNATGDTMTGNLGVNVSPTAALDVRRSDADGKIAEFHQNAGYGFDVSSSQTVATIGSGYLQALSVTTDAGSGAVERMRISKEGYVTMPSQPALNVVGNQSTYVSLVTAGGTSNAIPFNIVRGNGTSGFNTSTHVFTAPVAGSYLCTLYTLITTAQNHESYMYKNGSLYARKYTYSGRATSFSTIIPMAVNDYLVFGCDYSPYLNSSTANYTSASITLVG